MTTRCQLLPFVVTHCHPLPVVVTHCDSLSLIVPLVVTRCTTRCHSLYHLLPFDVSLVCLFIKNCIFYWKLIPGKKDFIFSSTKNLFRLFKATEINLVKNIFSFTIRIIDQFCNFSMKGKGICVSRPPALALDPGPNLNLTLPAPNLYFTAPVLNLCWSVLCFTVKVCYSYSVYLYKLSVYLYVLTVMDN